MKTSLQYMTPKSTRTKKRPTASSYLPLLKKVLAREKEIEELEVALREIQESKTYRLWQSYCQLRNALFSVKNNELPHYGHNSMYESLEEHFLSEFDRCQRRLQLLQKEKKILLSILEKLQNSKVFLMVSRIRHFFTSNRSAVQGLKRLFFHLHSSSFLRKFKKLSKGQYIAYQFPTP